MTGLSDPKSRLIFALDVPSLDEAVSFVQKLDGSVGMFKVGLELFIKEGPAVLTAIKDHSDAEIFLDLKLHDIPATVERAVQSAAAHKVRFLTVHCSGGETMLQAAVNGTGNSGVQILGVTVLTSIGTEHLTKEIGFREGINITELIAEYARRAKNAGCAGVVCSGTEVAFIRQLFKDPFLAVTPGIRPAKGPVTHDDQSRIATPGTAISGGADYLVVGRPIRDADDPKAAADQIVQEISEALSSAK
jgi:orotidine-5'-phosphate decarboxylase